MAVIVKPKFTKADITAIMQERLVRIDTALVMRLMRIGETFIKNVRSVNTYQDQTGNLRNSTGYLILRDGVQLANDFRRTVKTVSAGASGKRKRTKQDGVNAGKDLAFEVARQFQKGYVLIGVAGMEYAAAVESKGFDVLTSSSKLAENQLREAIKTLGSKIGKMK